MRSDPSVNINELERWPTPQSQGPVCACTCMHVVSIGRTVELRHLVQIRCVIPIFSTFIVVLTSCLSLRPSVLYCKRDSWPPMTNSRDWACQTAPATAATLAPLNILDTANLHNAPSMRTGGVTAALGGEPRDDVSAATSPSGPPSTSTKRKRIADQEKAAYPHVRKNL